MFPSHTETFIKQEFESFAKRTSVTVFAINRGNGESRVENGYTVKYFPRLLSLKTLYYNFKIFIHSDINYKRCLKYIFTNNNKSGNIKAFLRSAYLCDYLIRNKIPHIHSHFANMPADIAFFSSLLTHSSYSFSAHANDIYCDNSTLLRNIESALFVVTCTKFNKKCIEKLVRKENISKVHHVYHGIELDEQSSGKVNINIVGEKVNILTVGRLVEKKGYAYIPEAIDIAERTGLKILWHIVGDGPQKKELQRMAARFNIGDNLMFLGWQRHNRIRSFLESCDVFIMPSIVAADGDMDGLPNVIMEAMQSGIPIIASNISAIPEILNDRNSMIIPANDSMAISDAIIRTISYPGETACRIAQAKKDVMRFDSKMHFETLYEIFNRYLSSTI